MGNLRFILIIVFCYAGLINPSTANDDGGSRAFGEPFASRSAVYGQHGAVATSQPLASLTAIDILKKGGSAVDAAIAANAILSLTEPHMCGPGGDLFAIVWDPNKKQLFGLNASGRSAKNLTLEGLKEIIGEQRLIPDHGPLSVTVPGAVQGWVDLHAEFGKLDLDTILSPAIHYSKEGVVIPEISASLWALSLKELYATNDLYSAEQIEQHLFNFRNTFLPNNKLPREGELFRNPGLAKTLESIAKDGRNGFYEGANAENIVEYLQGFGSSLTLEDFKSHQSEWVAPISTNYRGYDIYQIPPNGQGLSVLQVLNILEGYDISGMGRKSIKFWHFLIEAKRLAYEDRAKFFADRAFSSVPVDWLISKEYADQRRKLIDPDSAMVKVQAGVPAIEQGDTTYITVADSEGYMVSMIQSVYGLMGSGMVPEGLGFVLQNRGAQFAVDAEHRNRYEPGKRPFHTIIPGFVTKGGKPVMSLGVVGGAMQPQAQVQVLVNLIDFGMDVQSAGDAARIRHIGSSRPKEGASSSSGHLYIERGVDSEIVAGLAEKGHHIAKYNQEASDYMGGYQAIMKNPDTNLYQAGSDMRLDGAAIAY